MVFVVLLTVIVVGNCGCVDVESFGIVMTIVRTRHRWFVAVSLDMYSFVGLLSRW